jgi:hypothetical protein
VVPVAARGREGKFDADGAAPGSVELLEFVVDAGEDVGKPFGLAQPVPFLRFVELFPEAGAGALRTPVQ